MTASMRLLELNARISAAPEGQRCALRAARNALMPAVLAEATGLPVGRPARRIGSSRLYVVTSLELPEWLPDAERFSVPSPSQVTAIVSAVLPNGQTGWTKSAMPASRLVRPA